MTSQRPIFGGTQRTQRTVQKFAAADAYAGIADAGRLFLAGALSRYFMNTHEYVQGRGVPPKYITTVRAADLRENSSLTEAGLWLASEAPAELSIHPHVAKEVVEGDETTYRCQRLKDRTGRLEDLFGGKVSEINAYPTLNPGIVCMAIETPDQNRGRLVVASMLNELVKTRKWDPVYPKDITDRKTGKTEPITSYDQLAGCKGKAEEYEAWLKSLKPGVDLLLPAGSKSILIAGNQLNAEEARGHLQRYLSAVDEYVIVWGL